MAKEQKHRPAAVILSHTSLSPSTQLVGSPTVMLLNKVCTTTLAVAMLLAGTQLAAADPGDCTVIELAAYKVDSDSDGKAAAMAANSADCNACLNEETACDSTSVDEWGSSVCCPARTAAEGLGDCACQTKYDSDNEDTGCEDSGSIGTVTDSDPYTITYRLNPDHYTSRCWKPIGACTKMSEYGSCETYAGVTIDDRVLMGGSDCLAATTEARCGNKIEEGLTYCIWDAAQVDGRRCQPKPELGQFLSYVDDMEALCNDDDAAACNAKADCKQGDGEYDTCRRDDEAAGWMAAWAAVGNGPTVGVRKPYTPPPPPSPPAAATSGAATAAPTIMLSLAFLALAWCAPFYPPPTTTRVPQ
jgi:hypothetical protein